MPLSALARDLPQCDPAAWRARLLDQRPEADQLGDLRQGAGHRGARRAAARLAAARHPPLAPHEPVEDRYPDRPRGAGDRPRYRRRARRPRPLLLPAREAARSGGLGKPPQPDRRARQRRERRVAPDGVIPAKNCGETATPGSPFVNSRLAPAGDATNSTAICADACDKHTAGHPHDPEKKARANAVRHVMSMPPALAGTKLPGPAQWSRRGAETRSFPRLDAGAGGSSLDASLRASVGSQFRPRPATSERGRCCAPQLARPARALPLVGHPVGNDLRFPARLSD